MNNSSTLAQLEAIASRAAWPPPPRSRSATPSKARVAIYAAHGLKCPSCGSRLSGGAGGCKACGHGLSAPSMATRTRLRTISAAKPYKEETKCPKCGAHAPHGRCLAGCTPTDAAAWEAKLAAISDPVARTNVVREHWREIVSARNRRAWAKK